MYNIIITGASSGLGASLATIYSGKDIRLFLTGRNQERLERVKKICQSLGAEVHIKYDLAIENSNKVKEWIIEIAKDFKIDLVIANAGISINSEGKGYNEESEKRIFDVNINGVLNTIYPAIEIMKQQKKGQIAIIGSLAGYLGMPSCPAYSASKAMVRTYAEGLRGNLAKYGIKVNIVTPGYIKTPMTDKNDFFMPLLMDSIKAAKIIKKGIEKNKSRIVFPKILYYIIYILNVMPSIIREKILYKLPKK